MGVHTAATVDNWNTKIFLWQEDIITVNLRAQLTLSASRISLISTFPGPYSYQDWLVEAGEGNKGAIKAAGSCTRLILDSN